jgi:hypothetical protein
MYWIDSCKSNYHKTTTTPWASIILSKYYASFQGFTSTICITWSETYVRYKWPNQRHMYDINDLIRAVCTIYITWSETYVRYTCPDPVISYICLWLDHLYRTYVSDQVMHMVHTSLIRSFISYIRLWSGHVYRTYVSDQVMYIVHTSLIRSFISYIRLWSGHLYRTYVSDQVIYIVHTSVIGSFIWPDQRRMYDIYDLIRDVCTI